MMTEKGRVVYEREEHPFSTKDIARIIKRTSASENPFDVAKTFAQVIIKYLTDKEVSYVMKIGFIIAMLNPVAIYMNLVLRTLLDALVKAHKILTEAWFK